MTTPLITLCLVCGNGHAKTVKQRNVVSRMLGWFGLRSFDCQCCGSRFVRFIDARQYEALQRYGS